MLLSSKGELLDVAEDNTLLKINLPLKVCAQKKMV
jgi:hypothetical protein